MKITTNWIEDHNYLAEPNALSPMVIASLAELSIREGQHFLTRAEDKATASIRNHAILPAYNLAEWLIWNWWRINYEPTRPINLAWQRAHRMSTIGDGWVWPNIEIQTDSQRIRVSSTPSNTASPQNLYYLGAPTVDMSRVELEDGLTEFIVNTSNYLAAEHGDETLLAQWHELKEEIEDGESSRYRELEARLGYDPDEAPETLITSLIYQQSIFGESAVSEIATTLNQIEQLRDLQADAQKYGVDSSSTDRIALPDESKDINYGFPAWKNGVMIAKALRAQERIGSEPIGDHHLEEWFAISNIREDALSPSNFAYELVTNGKSKVLYRAKHPHARRFEVARLIGDGLLQVTKEPLRPSTKQFTYRQKMQRAFAAELLCPLEGIKEFLHEDFSDESIENAANHFSVSEQVITQQLQHNNVIINSVMDY